MSVRRSSTGPGFIARGCHLTLMSTLGEGKQTMFGKRRKELDEIIPEETLKLSPKAKQTLDNVRPFIVHLGDPPPTFVPVSPEYYKNLDETAKMDRDHDVRVRYILTREIESLFLNRSMPEKLKAWLVRHKAF